MGKHRPGRGPDSVANLTFTGVHKHPKKRFFRARAHSNPLNDSHFAVPAHPDDYGWSGAEAPVVRFADIGCGFGGLLISLAPLFPDTLMVGMEIRAKVTMYVRERVAALRREHPGQYGNVTSLRTNAMKYLPNFFQRGQLTKLFFLFPDPHFKTQNHRRRIIQSTLLSEYAYVLAPGGLLYTITDVEELGAWMQAKLEVHPAFERVPEEQLEVDPAAQLLVSATEEGQKVARNGGQTWRNVYRRV